MNLEPLDDDILEILEAAKPIPELAPDAKAAIWASVEAKLVPPIPPAGGGDGGAGGGAAGAAVTTAKVLSRGQLTIALLAAFTLGAAVDRLLRPAPDPIVIEAPPREAPRPVSSSPPPAPEHSPPTASASAADVSPIATPPSRATAAPSAGGSLAAERKLLDVARTGLARGAPAEALAAALRHERAYPHGQLTEEREALAVKALVALGRYDEATTRAKRFEARYPNGLMLPAVKGAVEAR